MKKKLILMLLSPIAIASLVGCENPSSIMKLTYGTYITTDDNSLSDAKEISHDDLFLKMSEDSKSNNENFILVMADPSGTCACWPTFKPILKQFIKEYHYNVYMIDFKEFEGKETFGLTFKTGYVSMAIVKGRKILKQYPDCHVFSTAKDIKGELDKYVRQPELYLVDVDYLNDAIKYGEEVLVEYMRSGCGDCNYVNPQVLWKYAYENSFKTKMLVIDLQDLYDKQKEETGEELTSYQEFKNNYNLSTLRSVKYGYGNGVVPTFQYYKKGVIEDSSVYFNDEIYKVDDEYVIKTSFYDIIRESNLSYLTTSLPKRVLQGLKLEEKEVGTFTDSSGNNHYWWKQEYADVYHKPLLTAFLNFYTK